MRALSAAILAVVLAVGTCGQTASAQLAVSVNDGKVKLVDGRIEVQKNPQPDTVAIIDLRSAPPRIWRSSRCPEVSLDPPLSVAISPKEDFALVTSGRRLDPADATKQVPDDRLTVIDLTSLKPGLLKRLGSAVGVSKGPAPTPRFCHLAGRSGRIGRIHQQGWDAGSGRQPGRGYGLHFLDQGQFCHGGRQGHGRRREVRPEPRRLRARWQTRLCNPRE